MDETSYLKELDSEYQDLSASISRQLSQLKTVPTHQIREIIKQIKLDLESCSTSLKEMKQEIKTLEGSTLESWRNKTSHNNNDYISLKELYRKEKEAAQRKDLLGDNYDGAYLPSSKDDQRLSKVRSSSKQDTEVLRDAYRELNETEKNAEDIEENLYEQRTTMEKIKMNLIGGNALLGNMDGTVNTMRRRQIIMKILWCVAIFILLGVIALIIYFAVKPKDSK